MREIDDRKRETDLRSGPPDRRARPVEQRTVSEQLLKMCKDRKAYEQWWVREYNHMKGKAKRDVYQKLRVSLGVAAELRIIGQNAIKDGSAVKDWSVAFKEVGAILDGQL